MVFTTVRKKMGRPGKNVKPIPTGRQSLNYKTVLRSGLMLGFILFSLSAPGYAVECDTRDIPAALGKLIEEKKYDEAVAQAKAAYKNQAPHKKSESKTATLNLAKVYVNATLHSGMSFDVRKMGFKPGESGKKKISKEQLMAATRSALVVNPKYFEEADAFIQQTVKKWPDTKSLLYCLTKIHFYQGDHQRFLKSLSRTADAHKDSEEETVNFLLTYGAKYVSQRRYALAGEIYHTLLKIFPKSAPLLSSLGVMYINRGYTKKARDYFDKAYQQAPDDLIVVSNTAQTAMLLADFRKAEKILKQKAKLAPNKAEVYFDLAINAMSTGPKGSLPYWEKYFEINETFPDDEQWAIKGKMIQAAAKDKKYDEYDWLELGVKMIKLRTIKYAVPLIYYARKKQPNDARISYKLAHAYGRGKHYDLEELALLETLQKMKHPKNTFKTDKSKIYYNLARCAYGLDRLDDTETYLKNVKTDSKKAANADYMYGLVSQSRGNKEKAQRYFKSCVKKAKVGSIKEYCKRQIVK